MSYSLGVRTLFVSCRDSEQSHSVRSLFSPLFACESFTTSACVMTRPALMSASGSTIILWNLGSPSISSTFSFQPSLSGTCCLRIGCPLPPKDASIQNSLDSSFDPKDGGHYGSWLPSVRLICETHPVTDSL